MKPTEREVNMLLNYKVIGEVKYIASGHTASKWWSWDLNPDIFPPRRAEIWTQTFPPMQCSFHNWERSCINSRSVIHIEREDQRTEVTTNLKNMWKQMRNAARERQIQNDKCSRSRISKKVLYYPMLVQDWKGWLDQLFKSPLTKMQ